MKNSKKEVLITGGCGFVGRHLVKKLILKDQSLFIIDNLFTGQHPDSWLGNSWSRTELGHIILFEKDGISIKYLERDVISVFNDLVNGSLDVEIPDFSDVYHLASIVGGRSLIEGDPMLVATDLSIDTTFFLWATRFPHKFDRILFTSSSAAYPVDLQTDKSVVALKEEMVTFSGNLGMPDMTYGWSKLTGEYLAHLAHKYYGLHVACVRPFSGYGEDQDLSYPVPSIALRVARHDNPIDVWGTGEQSRDFVYIDDCIEAMFVILDKIKDGRGVNIGSGIPTSFNDLINLLLKLENYSGEINRMLDKPIGVQSRYADTTILNQEIGWKPSISLEDGMRRVLKGSHRRLDNKLIS